MTSIQERLQLKRVPLDTWNIREQLCLASAVVRSGDQNWMSVSRSLKTIGDPNRPADWYSQKSCATQYGVLLENVETPKRKKRNSEGAVETPQECILKKLTQERIAEIQNTLGELNHQYTVVKNEVSELRDSQTTEDRVKEIWASIEASKRTREKEQAKRAAWLKEREERRIRAERSWRPNPPVSTPIQAISSSSIVPAPQPSSPLLSSLLKSSPVVTTPQHITHPANCVETISPSAGAPTLSMLLDKRSSTHDTEHAAIEHIKSEIVQLERQLKVAASNSPPPVPITTAVAIPTTVSSTVDKIDIDDIEIKAEDVYAFSDIDLEIPPVSSIHKSSVIREEPKVILNEDESKKDEDVDVDTIPNDEASVTPPIVITNQDETPKSSDNPIEEETDDDEDVDLPEENNVTIPEVKFPTAEIKVISAEPAKEIKKNIPEVVKEVTKEDEIDVNVTDDDDSFSILPQDLDSNPSNEEDIQQSAAEVDADSALLDTPGVPQPPAQDQHVSESQVPTKGLELSDEQNVQESEDKQHEKANEPSSNTTDTETQDTETERSEPAGTEITETITSDTSIEPNKSAESNKTLESNKCIEADKSTESNKTFEADKSIESDKPVESSISNEADKSIEADKPIAADKSIEADKPIEADNTIKADKSVEADTVIEPENTKIAEDGQVIENLEVGAEKKTEVIKEESMLEKIKKELAEVLTLTLLDEMEDDTHTETDDDVPMELIREEEKDGKKKRDYSRKRKYESRTFSGSESAPESPAPSEADKQHRMWKKSVMVVHNRLCAHKYASLFLRPITNDQAPNYDKIVKKPMDLSSIKKNIDAGIIRTTSEFRRCVLLMLSNALFYNSVTHDVHRMTKEMHKEADAQLGMLLQAQAHAELPPAPRHHKRRAHTHAAKRPRIE